MKRNNVLVKVVMVAFGFLFIMPSLSPAHILFEQKDASVSNNDFELEYTLEFSLDNFEFTTVMGYDLIQMNEGSTRNDIGKPVVPVKDISIALPAGMEVTSVEIIATEKQHIQGSFNLFPSQPPRRTNGLDENNPFVEPDASVYNSYDSYPSTIIEYIDQTDLAGQSMAVVHLFPVYYIPAEQQLFMYSSLSLRIEGESGYICGDYLPDVASLQAQRSYEHLLKELVVNPDDVTLQKDPHHGPQPLNLPPGGPFEYVIITSTTQAQFWGPLVEWRTKRGMKATIVTTSYIYANYDGFTDQQKIRNFVEDAHDTWGTRYVLMGGEHDTVPFLYATLYYEQPNTPSDQYYSDYDDDWEHEVCVGRVTAEGSIQVTTFIDKVVEYETDPPLSNYLLDVLLIGMDADSRTPMENLKESIDYYIPNSRFAVTKVYDSHFGNHKTNVINALNDGQHLVNHADHGNWNFLGTGTRNHAGLGLNNGDIDALVNNGKPSIVTSLACLPNQMDANDCIAEHFVINNPDQAGVAFIGNTRNGYYNPGQTLGLSCSLDYEWWMAIFDRRNIRLGEILIDAKHNFDEGGENPLLRQHCEWEFSLLGDPAMPVWTNTPESFIVTHDSSIDMGSQGFNVHVASVGNVRDATVCLWKDDEVYEVMTTNGAGDAYFEVINPTSEGTMYVTVTYNEFNINYLPYKGEILVQEQGGDTDPPEPDPSRWLTVPYATGPTSISMAAEVATDPSGGVEYFFEETTGGPGGSDSGWQLSNSYVDSGLQPDTQYTYQVCTRDASQNTGDWSISKSATTEEELDTDPPDPDPSRWSEDPYATGPNSISMRAEEATDASGEVEYYFEEITGGGHDSNWQLSNSYIDSRLQPNTQYTYQVRTRDALENTGNWSTSKSATTDEVVPDNDPPDPDPSRWYEDPYATGPTSISMTAEEATDPNGVWYYFEEITGGGHDSNWQLSNSYVDSGLQPDTQYTYQVCTRDALQNTGDWSISKSATTDEVVPDNDPPFPSPLTWDLSPYATGPSSIAMRAITANDASPPIEYYFDYTASSGSGGTDSGWQPDDTDYEDTGLDPNTEYSYRVQARDSANPVNTGQYSDVLSTYTSANRPDEPWVGNPSFTMLDIDVRPAGNPDYTKFAIKCGYQQPEDPDWDDMYVDANGDPSILEVWQTDADWGVITLSGLTGNTLYTFNVKARNEDHVVTSYSPPGWSQTSPFDDEPPEPDPLTWAVEPYPTSASSIEMQATPGTDHTPPIYYEFDFRTGGSGGTDSGWQQDTDYEDSGLEPNTEYTYRCRAKDSANPVNTGDYSVDGSAWTFAAVPGRPDLYNPTATTLDIRFDPNGNPGYTEFAIRCVWAKPPDGSGTDPDWNGSWVDADGTPSTSWVWQNEASWHGTTIRDLETGYNYGFVVKARNQDGHITGHGGWGFGTPTEPDESPPQPNPLLWEDPPYAISESAIGMRSVVATDIDSPPVSYFFDWREHSGGPGGSNSGWLTTTYYEDGGLAPNTLYIYNCRARDSASPWNVGRASVDVEVYTFAATPGRPDLYNPTETTLDIDVDPNGNPEYTEFAIMCVWAKPPDGSGTDPDWNGSWVDADGTPSTSWVWQNEASWHGTTIRDLETGYNYGFVVKARNQDGHITGHGGWGFGTPTFVDVFPPTPDPLEWLVPPTPQSSTSIWMASVGVQDDTLPIYFYFDCREAFSGSGGTDSGWQPNLIYVNTELEPNTAYTYHVKARDSAPSQNEGNWSDEVSTYTHATVPGRPYLYNPTETTLELDVRPNGNPEYTEFAVKCVWSNPYDPDWLGSRRWVSVNGDPVWPSEWQTEASWDGTTIRGLKPGTGYCFKVMARNQNEIETAYSLQGCRRTSGSSYLKDDDTD